MSTTEKSLFGEILLKTRKSKSITQYKLSKLTGLSERHLNYIERGVREPRLLTIIRLAEAMNMLPGEMVNAYAARVRQLPADELVETGHDFAPAPVSPEPVSPEPVSPEPIPAPQRKKSSRM